MIGLKQMKPNDFTITIENDIKQIQDVAEHLESFGNANHISPKIVYQLNLSVDEILTNIITYGFSDSESHDITVSLSCSKSEVTIQIIDDGQQFDPLSYTPEGVEDELEDRPIGGLGIHLVKTMMDEIQYERINNENKTTIIKYIS